MATINLGSIKFNWQGAYAGGTAYAVDDVVSYSGSSYVCTAASTGNLPTDTNFWDQMSSAGTNGTNGTDLTTTLTTQGDLVYRDGSGLQRLGAGTSGQVLQTGGSGANPSWQDASGGALVKLASTKVSGGAVGNIEFNSSVLDTSTYTKFKFFIHMYGTVSGAGLSLYAKPSKDNGSTYNLNAFSAGVGAYVKYDGTNDGDYRGSMFDTGNNRWKLAGAVSGFGTGNQTLHWVGEANLYNPNDTSTYSQTAHLVWQGGRYYTSDGSDYHVMYQAGHGYTYNLGTGTPVNAIKFYWSSGNVQNDSRITVYGVKET